jgi:uncharacterized protein YegP (UPF0339 family)
MATATKKSGVGRRRPNRAAGARKPASMEFLVFQDNGGAYHWRIVAGDGATLPESGSFASYDLAEQAAHHVRDGAALARFGARAVDAPPVDLVARRHASNDDSDAERWLDEGGSFNSDAAAKWPARR